MEQPDRTAEQEAGKFRQSIRFPFQLKTSIRGSHGLFGASSEHQESHGLVPNFRSSRSSLSHGDMISFAAVVFVPGSFAEVCRGQQSKS